MNKLPDIKIGAEITRRMFDDGDVDIDRFYRQYFYDRRNEMGYLTDGGSIYDLLSANKQGKNAYKERKDKRGIKPPELRFAIRSAADRFYVIDKGREDVIVPYGDRDGLVSRFCAEADIRKKRLFLCEMGKYGVSLYPYQKKELEARGALLYCEGLTILRGFYDNERGLDLDGSPEFLFA